MQVLFTDASGNISKLMECSICELRKMICYALNNFCKLVKKMERANCISPAYCFSLKIYMEMENSYNSYFCQQNVC